MTRQERMAMLRNARHRARIAGNTSARKHKRTYWSREDWYVARQEYERHAPLDVEPPGFWKWPQEKERKDEK